MPQWWRQRWGYRSRTGRAMHAWLLLLPVLLGGIGFAAGGWRCTDGTPCVFTPGIGWHRQGVAAPTDSVPACCLGDAGESADVVRCSHGQPHPASPSAELATPQNCAYAIRGGRAPSGVIEVPTSPGPAAAALPVALPTVATPRPATVARVAPVRARAPTGPPLVSASPRSPPSA